MGMEMKRFDVYLISLDPTIGHEIKKTRPCLIISPNEMNDNISTVIVAPMTSKGRKYPTRISSTFQGIQGQIILDQIRTVDKRRLIKRLGKISPQAQDYVLDALSEIFAP
jgi:mRNA interferase MazF